MNNYYPPQAPMPQMPARPENQRTIIYGWSADQHGLEKGKFLEYVVEEFPMKNGSGKSVLFFKPYAGKNRDTGLPEWKKSYGFFLSEKGIRELVDRINHLVSAFFPAMGTLTFMQMQAPQQMPMQIQALPPQGYSQPMPPVSAMPPMPQAQLQPTYAPQQAPAQPAQQLQPTTFNNPFLNGDIPFG